MQKYDKTEWIANETLVTAEKLNKVENQLESLTNESIKFNEQLDNKLNKTDILTMANMGQDIKEKMTGGSVAVVGVGSTSKNNLSVDLLTKICERENITDSVESKNGYYINNAGVESTTSGLRYKKFIVSSNDVFYIKSGLAGHYANKPSIVFLNSNNQLIKAINETKEAYEQFVYSITDAKYMCINIHDDYVKSTKVEKMNLSNKNLAELEKNVEDTIELVNINSVQFDKNIKDIAFKTQDILKDKEVLHQEKLNYTITDNYNKEKYGIPFIQTNINKTYIKNFFYNSQQQFLSKKHFFVGFLIDSNRVGALNTVFTNKDTNTNSVITMYNEYQYGSFKLYYCKGTVKENEFIRQINLAVGENQLFTEPLIFTSDNEITNIDQVIKVFNSYLSILKTETYVNDRINDFKNEIDINLKDEVCCFGNSLTRGVGATQGNNYPQKLSTLIDKPVKNVGVGGEKTWDIACRVGALTMYAEPFTIPPDNTQVEITIKSADGYTLNLARAVQNETLNPVTIDGIQGNLSFNTSNNKNYFTRLKNGTAKTLTRPTRVTTKFINSYRGCILVLWSGSNEQVSLSTVDTLIKQQRNIIEHNGNKKYLVLGLTSKYHMKEVDEVNKILAEEYGSHFVDVRKYIMTPIENTIYGLDDYKIQPTQNDLNRIRQGLLPMSLLVDEIHGNDYFYDIVAKLVSKRGKELGYW